MSRSLASFPGHRLAQTTGARKPTATRTGGHAELPVDSAKAGFSRGMLCRVCWCSLWFRVLGVRRFDCLLCHRPRANRDTTVCELMRRQWNTASIRTTEGMIENAGDLRECSSLINVALSDRRHGCLPGKIREVAKGSCDRGRQQTRSMQSMTCLSEARKPTPRNRSLNCQT